jgi:nucleoside-diphosphate-sugar epimerase
MTARRTALVCGAGGFIGSHLARRLKHEGYWVLGVDLKYPEFSDTAADEFVKGDLRDQTLCKGVLDRPYDEVYQLAADMGGAGYTSLRGTMTRTSCTTPRRSTSTPNGRGFAV